MRSTCWRLVSVSSNEQTLWRRLAGVFAAAPPRTISSRRRFRGQNVAGGAERWISGVIFRPFLLPEVQANVPLAALVCSSATSRIPAAGGKEPPDSIINKTAGARREREQVLIQRGKNETFVLTAQQNPVKYDLARAVTVDEVIAKVREGLTELFEKKEAEIVK